MSKTNIKKFQKLIMVANTIAVSYIDYYQMAPFFFILPDPGYPV